MDRIGADFDHCIRSMRQRLGAHPVPLQYPLGKEDQFIGVIDFIEQKVIVYPDAEETHGTKMEIFPVAQLWDPKFVAGREDVAAAVKVMPRSRSCSIQSMVAVPSCTSPIL